MLVFDWVGTRYSVNLQTCRSALCFHLLTHHGQCIYRRFGSVPSVGDQDGRLLSWSPERVTTTPQTFSCIRWMTSSQTASQDPTRYNSVSSETMENQTSSISLHPPFLNIFVFRCRPRMSIFWTSPIRKREHIPFPACSLVGIVCTLLTTAYSIIS